VNNAARKSKLAWEKGKDLGWTWRLDREQKRPYSNPRNRSKLGSITSQIRSKQRRTDLRFSTPHRASSAPPVEGERAGNGVTMSGDQACEPGSVPGPYVAGGDAAAGEARETARWGRNRGRERRICRGGGACEEGKGRRKGERRKNGLWSGGKQFVPEPIRFIGKRGKTRHCDDTVCRPNTVAVTLTRKQVSLV
jgi:hypothetical protein